jgi:hypothetical protein
MNPEPTRSAGALIRAVATLQLKLLLDALRDIALSPLALGAAVLDLMLLKWRSPQLFRAVLRLGEHSDRWIDLWAAARDAHAPRHENVDVLLARVEEVVRDPQTGARRARVLKRWAERQLARARQHAALQIVARLPTEAESSVPRPEHQR